MPFKKNVKASRWTAEWNMCELDYNRYNKMLIFADACAVKIMVLDQTAILPYYAVLKELYRNFRPLIFITKRKWFDKVFDVAKKEIHAWRIRSSRFSIESFPINIANYLEDIHTELLEIKQMAGMGIPVEKEIPELTKWKRALRVDNI